MNKELKYYLYVSFTNIVVLFSSGSVIQSFLAYKGLTNGQIGYFTIAISVMQAITLLISAFVSDRIKNVPKAAALFTSASLVFLVSMFFIAISGNMSNSLIFAVVITACIIWNFFYGLRIVLDYKLPYYVADISKYALIQSRSGIILSILGFAVTGLFLLLTGAFGYVKVITVSFVVASVFAIGTAAVSYSLKDETPNVCEAQSNSFSKDVFRIRELYILALPNLLRGVGIGILNMASVIMLSTVTENAAVSSSLGTIGSVGSILSCFIYTKIYKGVKTTLITLFGMIIEVVALIFMIIWGTNVTAFIVFYFFAYFGQIFVDYSIPVYITEIISYNDLGGFTAIRMLLCTAGTAIGSFLVGRLADVNSTLLIIICISAQFITCLWYYIYSEIK